MTQESDKELDDYKKYRGKCKQFVDEACKNDPTLTPVRGHYHDPFWGPQPHWWCKKPDGTIFDPTKDQFPTKGTFEYEEFNGIINCSNCEKEIKESEALIEGNYAFCSTKCNMIFVGL